MWKSLFTSAIFPIIPVTFKCPLYFGAPGQLTGWPPSVSATNLTSLTLRMQHSEKLMWRRWLEHIGHFCHLSAPPQSISKNFNTVYIHRAHSAHRTPVFITYNIRIRCLNTAYKFCNFIILYSTVYCASRNLFYFNRNIIQHRF